MVRRPSATTASVTTQVMPASSGVGRGATEDLVVGDGDGLAHALGRRAERPRQPLQDDVARDGRRQFASGVAADAVDDAEDAALGVEHRQVLVVGAHAARDRTGRPTSERARRQRAVSHGRTSTRASRSTRRRRPATAGRAMCSQLMTPPSRLELDGDRTGQADARARRQRVLGPGLRHAFGALDRRRDGHVVDGRAPEADVLHEEASARRRGGFARARATPWPW